MTSTDENGSPGVGALAIQVKKLEDRVVAAEKAGRTAVEQTARLANVPDDLRALRDHLAGIPSDIEARLDRLAGQIAAIALGDSAESGPPVSWFDVTDADVAERMLTELADWVKRVVRRYPESRQLGNCWMHHPELVEQLIVLRLLWMRAYRNPDGQVEKAAEWQDRWLPGFFGRIREKCQGFGTGVHQLDAQARMAADDQRQIDRIPKYARWWPIKVAGKDPGEEPGAGGA